MRHWTVCFLFLNTNCKNLLRVLMSTNDEPKESTYYIITPLRYISHPKKPLVQIDGQFSVLEAERPENLDGMRYKVEFLTGTNNRNFYNDLEEMISTMEHENKDFQKHTVLKRIVKVPYGDMVLEPGTFTQIWQKHGCLAYELKEENELMRINYEDLVDKSSEGSCIFEVYDSYWDARKTIILSVQEIVVTGPITSPRKVVCNTDLTSELKNIQFCNFLKMPNNKLLIIENFDFEKLRAKTFESKKSGDFTLQFSLTMMEGNLS